MLLLQLPPETLKQIFGYCGSSYFQQDSRRLSISKRWFEFALPVCWKDLALSAKTLDRLTTSGISCCFKRLESNLQSLTIRLGGNQELPTSKTINDENTATSHGSQSHGAGNQPSDWISKLNPSIEKLIMPLKSSHKLQTVKLHAKPLPPRASLTHSEPYLQLRTIQYSLSIENLRHLVLDLSTQFFVDQTHGMGIVHICPSVSTLLPTLQTLHLRLPHICPSALTPPESDCTLRLSNLAINLSLYSEVQGISAMVHSTHCYFGDGLLSQTIREQAETLTKQMASPKVVRVLTHLPVQFELRSFDVLTGKTTKLAMDAGWDDDGEVVEEDESEHEFSDSDANDSFFDEDDGDNDGDGNEGE